MVNRFLAIVGASGSGKSSVVRAGLVAALKRDAVETPGYAVAFDPDASLRRCGANRFVRTGPRRELVSISTRTTLSNQAIDQALTGGLEYRRRPRGIMR